MKSKIKNNSFLREVFTALKKGSLATRLSFFVPGVGQMMRRQVGKGLVYLLAFLAFQAFMIFFGLRYISHLLSGDLGKIAQNLCNVFDPVVTADHLELNYIKSIFNSYGSVGQQMTGSGSAVFAIMPNFEYAAVVCSMLKDNYPQVYIARPI